MPDYKTHDKIAYITTPILIISASTVISFIDSVVFGGMFLLANRYLSPDLDIASILIKRWGVFSILWFPYRKIVPHRSLLSHSGPLSATIRLLYLSVFIIPIVFYFFGAHAFISHITIHWYWYFLFYISVVLADCIHTLADFWRF